MSDEPKQIRILVVDDHPLLRQGIASLIADESDMTLVAEVAEAANGPKLRRVLEPIEMVAPCDFAVLLFGETGMGKGQTVFLT